MFRNTEEMMMFSSSISTSSTHILLPILLLLLSGDIETNPGPFPSLPSLPSFDKKEDPVTLLQIVVDDQADNIRNSFDFVLLYL